MELRQGRCRFCNVRYTWPAKKRWPLGGAHCDECGVMLVQTNRLFKGPVRHLPYGPVYDEELIAARLKRAGLSPAQADYIVRRWP